MIQLRPAADRGHTQIGWLNSHHTFSFGEYRDPQQMGYRSLRVINDDRVIAGAGFGTHGHRDMEIVSYVLDGALAHKDSLGTGSVIRPGDVQRMSAGTGIQHSEFNASQTTPVHFLQIWILPDTVGLPPSYEQTNFPRETRLNRFRLIGDRAGAEGAVTIHQDVKLYSAILEPGASVTQALPAGRHVWLHVASGDAALGGHALREGDGVAIRGEPALDVSTAGGAELLLFDLA